MIHIINNYYAVPNNMGFTVVQDKGKVDKDGNKLNTIIGYCGNIEEVCHLAYNVAAGEKVAERDMELSEAIQIMKDTKQMIHKALEGLT